MTKSQDQIASLIKERRKELNINQEELSELTQIALRTIRDMEKGQGNPSLETIQKLLNVLGIELIFRLSK